MLLKSSSSSAWEDNPAKYEGAANPECREEKTVGIQH